MLFYPLAYVMTGASMASWLPVALWFYWVYDPMTRGCHLWEDSAQEIRRKIDTGVFDMNGRRIG